MQARPKEAGARLVTLGRRKHGPKRTEGNNNRWMKPSYLRDLLELSWETGRRRGTIIDLAERIAGVPKQEGGLWHPYRRSWATRRKHLPDRDVARAGGWKTIAVMKESYQLADDETLEVVVNEPMRLEDCGNGQTEDSTAGLGADLAEQRTEQGAHLPMVAARVQAGAQVAIAARPTRSPQSAGNGVLFCHPSGYADALSHVPRTTSPEASD